MHKRLFYMIEHFSLWCGTDYNVLWDFRKEVTSQWPGKWDGVLFMEEVGIDQNLNYE